MSVRASKTQNHLSIRLLALLSFCLAASSTDTRGDVAFDQEDSSICSRAPELQTMDESIGRFHCQAEESRHALNCSDKFIPALPRTSDRAVPRGVEILDFSRNKIKCLPKINNTVASCDVSDCGQGCILELHLQHNEIDYLDDEVFINLTCLRSLDLAENKLTSGTLNKKHFFKQGNLLHLDLHGNPLGVLTDSILVSTYMHKLQSLNLSSCKLTLLGPNSLDDFFELQTLDLTRNELTSLTAETFRGLKQLKTLDLRWNLLAIIKRDTFASMKMLQDLHLTHNHLNYISELAFSTPPPPISYLDLSFNHFDNLPFSALSGLKQLVLLDMSHNAMVELKPGLVTTSVRRLKMDFLQGLQVVADDAFSSFPQLTHLSLRHARQLTSISNKAFHSSSRYLAHVRLDNNALSYLSPDLLPWERLNYLAYDGNPWNCDCKLNWMAGHPVGNTTVRCQDPLKLRGQELSALSPDELPCAKPVLGAKTIIGLAINGAAVFVIAVVIWHRRRQLPCRCWSVTKGRYVTVFTKVRNLEDEVDSGNGSCADGEIDDLDLDLGTGSRARKKDAEDEDGSWSEGGRVMILMNTFRNGYKRLARKTGESTQDLTSTAQM